MKKKIKTDKGPLTNVFFFFLPSKFSFFLPLRIRENNCYFCIITIWFSSAYKSAISFVWQPNELGWNGTTDFLRRVFMKKKIAKWRNVWLRINKQHFNSFFCWESFIMLVWNYLSMNPLCVVTSTTVSIGSLKSNRNWCALIKKTTIMTSLTSKYTIFMQSWHQSIAITANHRFFRGIANSLLQWNSYAFNCQEEKTCANLWYLCLYSLTYQFPMHPSSTHWKDQNTSWFFWSF